MSQPKKCKFCGRDCKAVFYNGTDWNPGHLHPGWNRPWQCYEAELAQKDALLRDAEEFISEKAHDYYKAYSQSKRKYFHACAECHYPKTKGHKEGCGVALAQDILTRIREQLNEDQNKT